uniref:Uncharacterized protein n=1 Tax=Oryza meridionalis TaxID=40149 RepID=A0A0E0CJG5_9ORYZ
MRAPLGGQHMRGAGAAVRRSAGRLRLASQARGAVEAGGGRWGEAGRVRSLLLIVPKLFDDESNPWFCMSADRLKVKRIGDISGRGMSPLRYVLASPDERSLVGVMTRAMPWPPTPGKAVTMPNTKDAEKDRTAAAFSPPSGDDDSPKRSGVGWNAWPLTCGLPLVSSSRPSGVTMAVPSRMRSFTPAKPE